MRIVGSVGVRMKRERLIRVERQVGKDRRIKGQWWIRVSARRILLEMTLRCVRCLCQLLGDGDHGLSRGVTVGGVVGILIESSLRGWWN